MDDLRIAMLISGGGTTARQIILACKSGRLKNVVPSCVIASRPNIAGIERVKAEGIPERDVLVIQRDRQNPGAFGEAIIEACKARRVDLVGQYGWVPLTPSNVIEAFPNMINQHPGPLDPGRPDFGGRGMQGRAVHCAVVYFARKVEREFFTEATAQRVHPVVDRGARLRVALVPIHPDDDPISLAEKVLPVEWEVQIATLDDFANNRVREYPRASPLILPGEEELLTEAKTIARTLFPHG